MKRIIILYIFVMAILNPSFGQEASKGKIKRIVKTESATGWYNDDNRHVRMVEKTEVDYDIEGLKTHKKSIKYRKSEPYRTEISTFIYTENKKISKEKVLMVEDSINYDEIFQYENDYLKKWSVNYINDFIEINASEEYTVNAHGKRVRSDYFYTERDIETNELKRDIKSQFRYDEKENTIEENWLKSDSTYKYNRYVHIRTAEGKLKEKQEYNANNELLKTTTFNYKLDSKDNWILRKSYVDNILTETIYREIEYYD